MSGVLQNADKIRKQYEEQLDAVENERKLLQEEREKTKRLNGSLQNEREKLLQGSKKRSGKNSGKSQRTGR